MCWYFDMIQQERSSSSSSQAAAADEELPVESAELAVVVPAEREQVVLAVEELAEAVQHAVLEPEVK